MAHARNISQRESFHHPAQPKKNLRIFQI